MKYFWSLAILFVVACGAPQEQTEQVNTVSAADSLYKAAMDGHNVGMARIGEVKRLKQVVQNKIDSLEQHKAPTQVYQQVLDALLSADEEMTKWMQEFDPNLAGDSEASKTAYYLQEKNKVDVVTDNILSSIKTAQELTSQ